MRRYLLIGAAAAFVVVGVYILLAHHRSDSVERRRNSNHHAHRLADQARKNPEDPRYALQLLEIARGDYSFGATQATAALGTIGEAARPVIHELAALIDSPDGYVSREAARSLANLGPISEPALTAIVRQVEYGDAGDDTTWFAAQALGNIGKAGVPHLPLLRRRLGEDEWFDMSLKRAIQKLEDEEMSRD